MKAGRHPPDPESVTAAVLGFVVGAGLGWALSTRGGRGGREIRELVDELVRAGGEGLLPTGRASPALDRAIQRLRALGDRPLTGGPS